VFTPAPDGRVPVTPVWPADPAALDISAGHRGSVQTTQGASYPHLAQMDYSATTPTDGPGSRLDRE
jgi:hypothetical protein